MENDLHILGKIIAEMGVSNITAYDLQFRARRNVLQPTPVIKRIVLGQGFYPITTVEQKFREMRSYEPIRTCN